MTYLKSNLYSIDFQSKKYSGIKMFELVAAKKCQFWKLNNVFKQRGLCSVQTPR